MQKIWKFGRREKELQVRKVNGVRVVLVNGLILLTLYITCTH